MRKANDVLDAIESAISGDLIEAEDFIEGDHSDEAILTFTDGERWTIKVRPSRAGEGA